MSRIPRHGTQESILDIFWEMPCANHARTQYNLTTDENLPDEEGTETSRKGG